MRYKFLPVILLNLIFNLIFKISRKRQQIHIACINSKFHENASDIFNRVAAGSVTFNCGITPARTELSLKIYPENMVVVIIQYFKDFYRVLQ